MATKTLIKYQLSIRDKKLILVFSALLIVAASLFIAYLPNMNKAKAIEEENKLLSTKEYELLSKKSSEDKILKDNESIQLMMDELIDGYGTGSSTQSILMFLKSLQQASGMDISVIRFADPEYIYTTFTSDSGMAATDVSIEDEGNIELNGEQSTGDITNTTAGNITGYTDVVTIDFNVSYDGLKKAIDFINNSIERKNIKELTLAYDMTTGNLSGTMQINMYHLLGTGRMKDEPAIAGIDIGLSNIFGTIEVMGSDVNTEGAENVEDTGNAQHTESVENAEGSENIDNVVDTEGAEETEGIINTEELEGSGE